MRFSLQRRRMNDSDPADPEKPEETPDEEPGEGEEKQSIQKDAAGHLFSSRQMDLIVLNRLGVKPNTPAAQTEPPSDPPAELVLVLDMDGKTEEGDYSYNVWMKQLECMNDAPRLFHAENTKFMEVQHYE